MANLTVGLITKTQVTNREVFLRDTQIPGLGIRVLPSGRKSFVFQYRNNERRTRRIVLGRFGGLLLLLRHVDTLLGIKDPVMCLLAQGLSKSECC